MQGPSAWLVVANKVIIEGPNDGLFMYNGTPAAGNLIASDSVTAGVDAKGNNFVAGRASYSATFATALSGGQVIWYAGSLAGGWSSVATAVSHAVSPQGLVISGAGELVLQNNAGTASISLGTAVSPNVVVIQGNLSALTAAQPGSPGLAEVWHSLSLTTVTGSGNGVNGFRYKLMPDNTLLLEWDLNSNSVGNNVTIATLPSGWRPATNHNIVSGTYGGSTALTTGANPHFVVNASGTIVTGGFPAIAFQVCGTALIGMD